MSIGRRITSLREDLGVDQKTVAKAININPSVMNRIELGHRPLRDDEIIKIAKYFNVSTDFLLGCTSSEAVKKASSPSFNISHEEILHIKKYRTLDDVGKNVVDAVLETQIQRIAEKQGLSSDKAI